MTSDDVWAYTVKPLNNRHINWCSLFCPLNRGVHCGEVYIKTTEHSKYVDYYDMWSMHECFLNPMEPIITIIVMEGSSSSRRNMGNKIVNYSTSGNSL